MCKVKYFINNSDPEGTHFATRMNNAGITFCCVPTSGPTTLWIDGYACYGPTAVKGMIDSLVNAQAGPILR